MHDHGVLLDLPELEFAPEIFENRFLRAEGKLMLSTQVDEEGVEYAFERLRRAFDALAPAFVAEDVLGLDPPVTTIETVDEPRLHFDDDGVARLEQGITVLVGLEFSGAPASGSSQSGPGHTT